MEPGIIIPKVVDEFITELNGRYKEFISDIMLKHLLTERILKEYRIKYPATDEEEMLRYNLHVVAYHIGCEIFESILEHECKAGGNGHHVAQDLATKFIANEERTS